MAHIYYPTLKVYAPNKEGLVDRVSEWRHSVWSLKVREEWQIAGVRGTGFDDTTSIDGLEPWFGIDPNGPYNGLALHLWLHKFRNPPENPEDLVRLAVADLDIIAQMYQDAGVYEHARLRTGGISALWAPEHLESGFVHAGFEHNGRWLVHFAVHKNLYFSSGS